MSQLDRAKHVEESLRAFYDNEGWKDSGGQSKDAALWEDSRDCAREYVSACRLRLKDFLPATGERLLDAASGPIQYPEYLTYSQGFRKRVCVDLSAEALAQAKARLGDKGEYLHCSLLDLPLESNSVDAAVSLHTIYHIESEAQVKAVQELLRVTKPGQPLIVVYANPDRISSRLARMARGLKSLLTGGRAGQLQGEVYYHAHPLAWWRQFSGEASVEIYTWRTLTAKVSRALIPGNAVGRAMLGLLFWLERSFPRAMLPFAAYPMIVLKKR